MKTFPASQLIINADGSAFHLHLKPEFLADKIILVLIFANYKQVGKPLDTRQHSAIPRKNLIDINHGR